MTIFKQLNYREREYKEAMAVVDANRPKVAQQLNYDPTDPDKMRLATGTTCGDCAHIRRCNSIFGHVETDTYCDWSPSRFAKAKGAA